MKAKDIKNFTDKELKEKLQDEKVSLNKMVLSHGVTPMENPMRMRHTRKAIARLATEIRKRQTSSSANN